MNLTVGRWSTVTVYAVRDVHALSQQRRDRGSSIEHYLCTSAASPAGDTPSGRGGSQESQRDPRSQRRRRGGRRHRRDPHHHRDAGRRHTCCSAPGPGTARTTAQPGPTPPTSTSTIWSPSPRRGAPGRGPGPQPKRQAYANDLGGPELWAVTDNVNQSKGDQDPATWQPPRAAFRCTYARAWIQVKWYYHLTVDSAEKSALNTMLATC
jgi:hypothetical protein